ncbi:regulator of G-protein signaling 14 isoform 4-T4 [Hipposideros larvatus]
MPGKPKHLGVPNGRMVLAVSDGELSSTARPQGQGEGRGSSLSVHSLPSGPSSPFSTEEQPVASWGLSFERLLQDPLGLAYFTEFLKKEFSAENVTFWKACQRFQQIPASDTQQLAQEARSIYQEFLSSQALSPVNIDRQAWLGEEVLADPRPDMFRAQQLQIFNLMKFDSYARFVKSPLYRECLLAEAEGRSLPEPGFSRLCSPDATRKKPKLKPGKSLPLGVEELGQLPPAEGPGGRQLRKSFRRELAGTAANSALRRESQGSLNSSASLDLGFLAFVSSKSEKALVLDQDCTVLADQEVRLENRITFELELAALQRVVRISAKPTKRVQEALQPILAKHGLSPQQVALRRPGEQQLLDLEKLVSSVAAQRLVLHTLPGAKISEASDTSPCCSQGGPPRTRDKATHPPPLPLNSLAEAPSSVIGKRQTCDIEGLVELLNRVQSSGAHDQRGLLRKEDLVLPEFLQLPPQGSTSQKAPPQTESSAHPKGGPSDSTAHSVL